MSWFKNILYVFILKEVAVNFVFETTKLPMTNKGPNLFATTNSLPKRTL